MTSITKTVLISKPLETTWRFLNDIEKTGHCLPGCQEVKIISETRSLWKLKVSAGIVSRTLEMEVTRAVDEASKRINLHIRTRSGDLEGDLVVALTNVESATKLDLNFDVHAVGAFSWIINQMIGKQSDKMAAQFVECVDSSL
ncbi:MAG: CoxG family protein [Nitrososphaerales archaeon]